MKKVNKDFFHISKSKRDDRFDFFEDYGPVNASNFPQHFFPIVSLFAKDSNYNIINLYSNNGNLYLTSLYKGEKNELLLRYNHNGDLVIAKVQFIHQRQGNMLELIECLKKIKRRYSMKRIVLESVISESMHNWCMKYELKEIPYQKLCYEFN